MEVLDIVLKVLPIVGSFIVTLGTIVGFLWSKGIKVHDLIRTSETHEKALDKLTTKTEAILTREQMRSLVRDTLEDRGLESAKHKLKELEEYKEKFETIKDVVEARLREHISTAKSELDTVLRGIREIDRAINKSMYDWKLEYSNTLTTLEDGIADLQDHVSAAEDGYLATVREVSQQKALLYDLRNRLDSHVESHNKLGAVIGALDNRISQLEKFKESD